MCELVAVLPSPPPNQMRDLLPAARQLERLHIPALTGKPGEELATALARTAVTRISKLLANPESEQRLLTSPSLAFRIRGAIIRLQHAVDNAERHLRTLARGRDSTQLTVSERELTYLAAALWDLGHDRLSRIDAIASFLDPVDLDRRTAPASVVTGYGAIETALRGLDRMESSGESAEVAVWVRSRSMSPLMRFARVESRSGNGTSAGPGAVRATRDGLAFRYTIASANAQAGDNVALLREAIARDALLAKVLMSRHAQVSILACSCMPTCGILQGIRPSHHGSEPDWPCSTAAVDTCLDHADLQTRADHSGSPAPFAIHEQSSALTTHDAGDRHLLFDPFANSFSSSTGPRAVVSHSENDPDGLILGVRGSAHSLCVGLAPTGWIDTDQPYGLIGDTNRYLRVTGMDQCHSKAAGTIVSLRRGGADEVSEIRRYCLDGTPRPIQTDEIETTEIRAWSAFARSALLRAKRGKGPR